MLISHKHKFIFVKTRKTAGTSIELGLSRFCDGPDDVVTPLVEPKEMQDAAGHPGHKNCIVPWNSMTARDLAKLPLRGRPEFYGHSTAEFIKQHIPDHIWDSYFVFAFERNPYTRALSQFFWNTREGGSFEGKSMVEHFDAADPYRRSNWECYAVGDQVVVDRVYHYETLADDLKEIERALSLPSKIVLPNAKTGHRPSEKKDAASLSDEMIDRVTQACSRELEYFGYSTETPQPTRLHTKRAGSPLN